jgi:hypothetical protein
MTRATKILWASNDRELLYIEVGLDGHPKYESLILVIRVKDMRTFGVFNIPRGEKSTHKRPVNIPGITLEEVVKRINKYGAKHLARISTPPLNMIKIKEDSHKYLLWSSLYV